VVSYRTNEVNTIASLVAATLACITPLTIPLGRRTRVLLVAILSFLAVSFFYLKIPVLLLWIIAALAKLLYRRSWGLAMGFVGVVLLPYGGRIGGPVYALFPIVLAVFVTALDWTSVEYRLSLIRQQYLLAFFVLLLAIVVTIRIGLSVPL